MNLRRCLRTVICTLWFLSKERHLVGQWLSGAEAHLHGAGGRVCQANQCINRIRGKNFI